MFTLSFSHLLSSVRDAIREYHPRFTVMAHMWPAFLYPKGQYNPQRPSAGLFTGELLLRVRELHSTRTIQHTYFIGLSLHLHVSKFCS
jgi:hypothetical protein